MTPAEAAKLLELPETATPEQIEARFHELRTKLEEKIGKAPTPGLKAKYRESLDEITAAFETLTLAADSSALPVLRREQGEGRKEKGGAVPAPSSLRPAPATRRKSGWEFAVVALIAVAVLGAGGWWLMKARAEAAEKARLAAEAQAASEAEAERRTAEATRQAEEEEKVRLAAAENAELERRDKLLVALRVQLADVRVAWSGFEDDARRAERTVAEMRSDLRGAVEAGARAELEAGVAAHSSFAGWLVDHLARHPARTLRAQAEELVSARSADAAAPVVAELKRLLATLPAEIETERQERLVITGALSIESNPAGLRWELTDAYGRRQEGVTPAVLSDAGLGRAQVEIYRPGWPVLRREAVVTRGETARVRAEFPRARVALTSLPAGAEVRRGQALLGRTPLEIELPPGETSLVFAAEGHHAQTVVVNATAGAKLQQTVRLVPLPSATELATEAFWRVIAGKEWYGKINFAGPMGVEFTSRNAANVNLYAALTSDELAIPTEVVSADPEARVVRLRFQQRLIGSWAVGDEAEVRLVTDQSMEFTILKKKKTIQLAPR
jgi:hypothetical protein